MTLLVPRYQCHAANDPCVQNNSKDALIFTDLTGPEIYAEDRLHPQAAVEQYQPSADHIVTISETGSNNGDFRPVHTPNSNNGEYLQLFITKIFQKYCPQEMPVRKRIPRNRNAGKQ
jgi:hypothetical protein